MIKVKEVSTGNMGLSLEANINGFFEQAGDTIKLIDIKYTSRGINNDYSSALIIYETKDS